jgi:hypothetical protein
MVIDYPKWLVRREGSAPLPLRVSQRGCSNFLAKTISRHTPIGSAHFTEAFRNSIQARSRDTTQKLASRKPNESLPLEEPSAAGAKLLSPTLEASACEPVRVGEHV